MARGFFAGIVAGTLVSGLALAAASVLTSGLAGGPPPAAVPVDLPPGTDFGGARDDTSARLPDPQEAPAATGAPRVTESAPDDLGSLAGADRMPAGRPQAGQAEGALATPESGASGAGMQAAPEDAPPTPGAQAGAPAAPQADADVPAPATPARPLADGDSPALAVPDAGAGDAGPDVATGDEGPVQPGTQGDAPAAPTGDSGVSVRTSPAGQPQAGGATAGLTAPEGGDVDSGVAVQDESPVLPSPQAAAPAAPGDEGNPSISTDPAQPAQPPVEETTDVFPAPQDPAGAGDGPATAPESTQATETQEEDTAAGGTIADLAPEVTTNRLPAIGVAPAGEGDPAASEAAAGDTAEAPPPAPPIERFAADFEAPGDRPLMAIILIDDGSSPIGLEALASFPYPLSFAIDAAWPGAAEAARAYRAAGFEVLAMADLPEGAGARDTEVAMQSYLRAVPEAVAVMEGPGAGLQANREASEQLAPILLDSGHGLVMFSRGLDTVQKLIAREGVPSATVFRDFDSEGQDVAVIRRFLDQAAFRASQEETGVIMLGRLRAETVSALILWGLQDRASRVALAPVSALLRAQ